MVADRSQVGAARTVLAEVLQELSTVKPPHLTGPKDMGSSIFIVLLYDWSYILLNHTSLSLSNVFHLMVSYCMSHIL